MVWRNRPGFDPSKIDPNDESTWAIRPGVDSTPDVSGFEMTEQQCAVVAAILDRARAHRARESLRSKGSDGT